MCYRTGKRDYSFDIDKNEFSYFKRLLGEEETNTMSRSYSSVLVGDVSIKNETKDEENVVWTSKVNDWRKVNWGNLRFPLPPFYFCEDPKSAETVTTDNLQISKVESKMDSKPDK